VKWYLLTDEQNAELSTKRSELAQQKEYNVQKTRELQEIREANRQEIYDNSLETYHRLIQRTADRINESNKNERYYQVLAQEQLHTIIQDNEKRAEKRVDRRTKILTDRKKQEMHRLTEILNYDKKEWLEEKEMVKRLMELKGQEEEEEEEANGLGFGFGIGGTGGKHDDGHPPHHVKIPHHSTKSLEDFLSKASHEPSEETTKGKKSTTTTTTTTPSSSQFLLPLPSPQNGGKTKSQSLPQLTPQRKENNNNKK
jgi:hypothetical protein